MNFSDYINSWLYDSDGYYSSYKSIGKEGDFFTSVSTSMLFGGSIAKKIIDVIDSGFLEKDTTILEIGAHHGYLLADIVQFIYTLKPQLLKTLKFGIVERFAHLREKQNEYFKQSFGNEVNLVHFEDISKVKLDSAYIIANEIFDAFACELIITEDDDKKCAIFDENIKFVPCENEFVKTITNRYKITKGEIAIGYEEFAKNLSKGIKKFEFLTFDYGEKYPRNDISLRIYSEHNVYPFFDENIDLQKLYKNSDITYDVNFSHLIDAFKDSNINNTYYKTQAVALIDFGIIDLLEIIKNNCDENTYLKESNKVKLLIEPTGMGDRFKALVFRKS